MAEKSQETKNKILWAWFYRNKSEQLGRKPMCKNCIYFVARYNWLSNWYFCMADCHNPKSRHQRCMNNHFEAILDCPEIPDELASSYFENMDIDLDTPIFKKEK